VKKNFKNLYEIIIKLAYRFIYFCLCNIPVFKLYQPIFGKNDIEGLTRECEDRWNVFSQYMPNEKGSVLDIGCNIGYFSFKSAQLGHFSYGIESDPLNYTICNAIKSAKNVKQAVFIKYLIDLDYLKRMPTFDTIINLSVFHHWVKAYGENKAQEMMKILAQKCQCLIFETGQPNETGSQWPKHLKFMGNDPDQWITNFLKEIGFNSVEIIGTFPTGLTQTDRYLFVAKKPI